jgi:hypothetical protein
MDDILAPVVRLLLFHESLFRPEGLGGGDASWRGVISGLEVLVSVKSIATMITRMEEWNPQNVTAASFERVSLLGPLCRLGVFSQEWVCYLLSIMLLETLSVWFLARHRPNIFLGTPGPIEGRH